MERMQPGVSCCQIVGVCFSPLDRLEEKEKIVILGIKKIGTLSAREAASGNFYGGEFQNFLIIIINNIIAFIVNYPIWLENFFEMVSKFSSGKECRNKAIKSPNNIVSGASTCTQQRDIFF